MDIFFKSESHKARFLTALREMDKIENGRADSEYGSALYILSATSELWEKSAGHRSRYGIRFAEMMEQEHFSTSYGMLVRLAWNLFNGGYSEQDQPRVLVDMNDVCILDEANFQVVQSSLVIRRNGYHVDDIVK